MRLSRAPATQYMTFWVHDALRRYSSVKTGLDVACGFMDFRPYFKSAHYIGVDLDPERIAHGQARYPDITAMVSSIEDLPQTLAADIVLCIETIGINNHFNPEQTVQSVQKLINATHQDGTLIFNIGPESEAYFESVDKLIAQSFSHVRRKDYGFLRRRFAYKAFTPLSFAIAIIMLCCPPLRTLGHTPYRLYIATRRAW